MRDLTSKTWIVIKGVLFAVIALAAAALILGALPSVRTGLLLALLVWSSCRFYYFLFYVLERYVDPTLRYSGLLDLLVNIGRRARPRRAP